ncbi:MAG: DUF2997 domain-containing protein [Chloroflexota bacterium]
MQREEIEILVHPDGSVEYTIKGIKGSGCESISQLLEQLGRVEVEEKTGEYYDFGQDVQISIGEN